MSEPTAEECVTLAQKLARDAGAVQLQSFRTFDPSKLKLKSRRNPVTEADVRSEEIIVAGIHGRFPNHAILGEEGGARTGNASTHYQWIVDPLDGTVNYSHGIPLFSVAIALLLHGQLLASVVYAPALDEMYTARTGCGAFCNGTRISVSKTNAVHEALLATGFSYYRNDLADNNVGHFNDLILRCRDVRRLGSAAYDLALTAAGRLDAYWELRLSPWDIAAGALLVQEAGGVVSDLHGSRDIAAVLQRGDVLASNGTAIHEELVGILSAERHSA